MTGEQLFNHFISNPAQMAKFGKAIHILREIGFENVARRLGEPVNVPYEAPLQVMALDSAERRGWLAAVNLFFDIDGYATAATAPAEEADFGSSEVVKQLTGATDKELSDV